jgi:hypothetical protein
MLHVHWVVQFELDLWIQVARSSGEEYIEIYHKQTMEYFLLWLADETPFLIKPNLDTH